MLLFVTGCGSAASPPPERPPPPPPVAPAPRNVTEEPSDEIGETPPEPALGVEGVAEPLPSLTLEPTDADVAAALAEAQARRLPAALRRLTHARTRIDREANLRDRMLAHALTGRGYAAAGKRKLAAAEYREVVEAWATPAAAVKQIVGSGGDDESERIWVPSPWTALEKTGRFAPSRWRR